MSLNFDTLLGEIFRLIAIKELSVSTVILRNGIEFNFCSKEDVFEIYYSEFLPMGSIETAKRILTFIKDTEFEYIYCVKYKDRLFNINETFKNLQNAQDFCHEINCKFELNIKPEIASERIKKN